MFKAGFVSIVGKPNAGKSTLINTLVGFKVAISTPKPQTTRFNIKGILTSDNYQIVFTDTPGIHTPKTKANKYMMDGVDSAVKNTDVILYLIDATKPKIDEASARIMKNIAELSKKVILVINKIDKIEKEKILKIIQMYNEFAKGENLKFLDVIPISVYNKDGLDILLKVIADNLSQCEKIYDDDEFTDMTEREIAQETIREKILNNLDEEVPHGVNVAVDSFKERINKNGAIAYDIEATITCLKKSHKPIIIVKNGSMLNHIKNLAKIDLEKTLGVKINLKLWVKVKEDWMENENYLKNIKARSKS